MLFTGVDGAIFLALLDWQAGQAFLTIIGFCWPPRYSFVDSDQPYHGMGGPALPL